MSEKEKAPSFSLNQDLECKGCGAVLQFKPGTDSLSCEYCGAENEIRKTDDPVIIEETSLEEYFNSGIDKEDTVELYTVRCNSCDGETTFEPNIASGFCPFCDNPLIIKDGTTARIYKPKYILPFNLDKKKALSSYGRWLKSLWFAPSDLKHYADNTEHFNGIYIPHWTYDCCTETDYTGERGDDYTEEQHYYVMEDGRRVEKTNSITRTDWSYRSGRVSNVFDDILVIASKSMPREKMEQLKVWDLKNLVPYDDKYLSGFRAETYQVKIEEGYEIAKEKMANVIHGTIRNDIGGDRQRVHRMNTRYTDATFKQILIPVWISAYRYKGKVYQFIINGRTGDIVGERPYSVGKIALAVIAGLLVFALIMFFGK